MKNVMAFVFSIVAALLVIGPASASGENADLVEAAANNSLDEIKILIAGGCDVDSRDSGGRTPLMAAIEKNHIEAVNFLISRGADLNARDKIGWSPMLYAVTNDRFDTAAYLIEKKVSVDSPDDGGTTALMYAVMNGSDSMVEMLLKNGADPNAFNKENVTPLICAFEHGNAKLAARLIEARAYPNDSFLRGITAGKKDAVKAMIENGCAAVNSIKDPEGRGAAIYATIAGDIEMMKTLLHSGANFNAKDAEGRSAMFYAAESGKTDVMKFILHDAELAHAINSVDNSGRTALFGAAAKGDCEMITLMLENRANPHYIDKNGFKAADLARANKMESAAAILERAMNPGGASGPAGGPAPGRSAFSSGTGEKPLFESNSSKKDDAFDRFVREQEEKNKFLKQPANRPNVKGSTTYVPANK